MAKLISNDGREMLIVTQNRDSLKVFAKPGKIAAEVVRLNTDEESFIVELANGKKRKEELYRGNGYLSSSSRAIIKSKNILKITPFNRESEKR
jgi:hypothetical protein